MSEDPFIEWYKGFAGAAAEDDTAVYSIVPCERDGEPALAHMGNRILNQRGDVITAEDVAYAQERDRRGASYLPALAAIRSCRDTRRYARSEGAEA